MNRLMLKQVWRSGGVRVGILVLLVTGIVSLWIGRQFLDRQTRTIAETRQFQHDDLLRNAAYHPDEIGLLLYYVRFGLVNDTAPLAGLVIGQRDVNPSVQRVTIRTLEAQKYDADLTNPANLLLGNLDFSFVLIYLFPLLIIGLTYNLISEEKERGTWRLVAVQQPNLMSYVARQYGIRIGLVMGVLTLLLVLAIPVLGLRLDASFWTLVALAVLYILVWFGLSVWVASFQQRSSANALWLLTTWLVMLVLLPAVLNTYIVTTHPVPEALSTTLKQRKSYHEKWDQPVKPTLAKFYAHYPQLHRYPVLSQPFNWTWYYAMQQLGDDESARQAAGLRHKLEQRELVSQQLAVWVPTLHTQIQLAELARTELGNQLRFLDETSRFHEKIRLYFYPKIMANAPVKAERWGSFNLETFRDNEPISFIKSTLPLVLFALFFTGLGWLRFRRSIHQF